jgi:hypothetical protein
MFIDHGVLSKTMSPFYGRQNPYAANGADDFFGLGDP